MPKPGAPSTEGGECSPSSGTPRAGGQGDGSFGTPRKSGPPRSHSHLASPRPRSRPASGNGIEGKLADTETFWKHWASHKARLQQDMYHYLLQQESLVHRFLHDGVVDPAPVASGAAAAAAAAAFPSPVSLSPYLEPAPAPGDQLPQEPSSGSGAASQAARFAKARQAAATTIGFSEDVEEDDPEPTQSDGPGVAGSFMDEGDMTLMPTDGPSTLISIAERERSRSWVSATARRSSWLSTYRNMKKEEEREKQNEGKVAKLQAVGFRRSRVGGVAPWLFDLLGQWTELEEPPRDGFMAKVLRHHYFELVSGLVIASNSFYTAYELNFTMDNLGETPPEYYVVDSCFLGIYIVELVVKMCVHRLYFFCNPDAAWNIFDTLLVLIALLDRILFLLGATLNVTFARSLRLFRMGRILRVFRAVKFLKQLRVMLSSIMGSFASLFWSGVLIGLVLFIFGLMFMQQVVAEFQTATEPYSKLQRDQLIYFSSVERSMLTLLQTTMGGLDWDAVYVLIEPLGPVFVTAFIFYIAFFNFAVMNILTGIFVENAMKLCAPDAHELEIEQKRKRKEDMAELQILMEAMHISRHGRIKKDAFVSKAQRPEVVQMFSRLGIEIKDPEVFFCALAENATCDESSVSEFIAKAMHMKGHATSFDLHGLIRQNDLVQGGLCELQEENAQTMESMGELRAEVSTQLGQIRQNVANRSNLEVLSLLAGISAKLSDAQQGQSQAVERLAALEERLAEQQVLLQACTEAASPPDPAPQVPAQLFGRRRGDGDGREKSAPRPLCGEQPLGCITQRLS